MLLAALLELGSPPASSPAGLLAQEPPRARPATLEGAPPPRTPLLDVPFLPQDVLLCGGAAAAMVLRYWGDDQVRPREFASLVRPAEGGIRAGELVDALRARGWQAHPFRGEPSLLAEHVERGRPVVALIAAGEDAFHYVVVLAWTPDAVVVHDPAEGPFRTLPVGEFRRRWAAGGEWSLLVLPGRGGLGVEGRPPADPSASRTRGAEDAEPAATHTDPAARSDDACSALAREAVGRARDGDPDGARALLDAAGEACAGSPAALRERAGLAFREEAWPRAASLAERATDLDPDDPYGWRLLASSRYLAGNEPGALAAWNRVGEPRIEALEIEGLRRTRYAEGARLLGLTEGEILTPGDLLRSRRRLDLLPAAAGTAVRVRPLESGGVRVQAAVAERSVVPTSPFALVGEGLRAGVRREARLQAATLLGRGELWTAAGRWWDGHPAAALVLEIPAPAGVPGVVRLEASWERRSYGFAPDGGDPSASSVPADTVEEERRRLAVGFQTWAAPTLRLSGAAGAEGWTGRGAHLLLAAGAEHRSAGDRFALGAGASAWIPTGGSTAFGALTARAGGRSAVVPDPWLLSAHLGVRLATAGAPLGLWAGAGAEPVAYGLLRGHALLQDGVVRGPIFGRTLVHGGVEARRALGRPGPLALEAALFVDWAVAWHGPPRAGLEAGDGPELAAGAVHADPGTGLRLGLPGAPGLLHLDVARDLRGGRWRGSAGWRVPWPTLGHWWGADSPVP